MSSSPCSGYLLLLNDVYHTLHTNGTKSPQLGWALQCYTFISASMDKKWRERIDASTVNHPSLIFLPHFVYNYSIFSLSLSFSPF